MNVQKINSIVMENVDHIVTTSSASASASSPSVVAMAMRNDIRWHIIHFVSWGGNGRRDVWFMMDGGNGRRDVWLLLQVVRKHVLSDHTAVDERVIGVFNDLE